MNRRHRTRDRHAFGESRRFAVECPGCRAHVAVALDLVGRAAGCPECRTAFLVPPAEREESPLPGSFEPVGARRRAALSAPVEVPLPEQAAVPDREPAPPPADDGRVEPTSPSGVVESRPARADGGDERRDEPIVFEEPPPPSTRRRPLESLPDVVPTPVFAVQAPPATALEADGPSVAPPAADVTADLAFREPVRTVTSAGAEIELRRLTPEALRTRRTRRNLLILVVGAALLVALVVILGKAGR